MKKLRSLWKDFLKKGFAILTIFMMLGQLGQGAITAFANELAVGDNGALDVALMYGDKQEPSRWDVLLHRGYHVWLYPDHP